MWVDDQVGPHPWTARKAANSQSSRQINKSCALAGQSHIIIQTEHHHRQHYTLQMIQADPSDLWGTWTSVRTA